MELCEKPDCERRGSPALTSKYGQLEMTDYAKALESLPKVTGEASPKKRKRFG